MTNPSGFEQIPPAPALMIVVSGPSGVGKSVVCDRLVEADPGIVHQITATTRPPRRGEKDAVDYHFWSPERFEEEMERGHFLETAVVHDHLYGTPRDAVEEHLRAGRSPVVNIDIQGGHSIKAVMPEAVLIFLTPPSLEVLERRLRGRGTDSEEVMATRLRNALVELRDWVRYDYAIVNDDLEETVRRVRAVIDAERARVARLRAGETG